MVKHLTLNYIPSHKNISLLRELEQVWKQTDIKPEKLEELEPEIPYAGRDLWKIFWELKNKEVITWSDIRDYCYFMGMSLGAEEAKIIIGMDSAYNKYVSDTEKKKINSQTKKNSRPPSRRQKV